jgi:hypothetical protein
MALCSFLHACGFEGRDCASARGGFRAAPLNIIRASRMSVAVLAQYLELLPFAPVPISTAGVLPPGVVCAAIPLPVIRMNHNVRT